MNRPLVSIGIPAFKGRYFAEALKCWKTQTYGEFEVIVRDDRSPDGLERIFDEVCGDDPRFRFTRNEKPTAPNFVDNWMLTLADARGEFFVLGSDDDIYEPDYLERMVALAADYPAADVFDARHDFVSDRGVVVPAPEVRDFETQIEWLHAVVCGRRNAIAQSVMCRTAALRALGGFVNLPAAWGGCDWLTWAKLAKNGVANSREVLMHWRTDGGNTTSAKDPYWTRQKLDAVHKARGLWKELVESLRPSDDDSARMVMEIREKAVRKFFRWMELCVVDELPPSERRHELAAARSRGDIGFFHFVGRWFGGAR